MPVVLQASTLVGIDLFMTFIKTQRTLVDHIRLEDAPFFVTLLNTPDWIRFIGDRNVSDIDSAQQYLQNGFLQSYRDNGFGYYLVRMAQELTPIGICGFLKRPNLDNPDFGFALLPNYYGQGLAYESCRSVLEYGIKTFEFNILDAVTVPDNRASIRLLDKLGFTRHEIIDEDNSDDPLVLYRWRSAELKEV